MHWFIWVRVLESETKTRVTEERGEGREERGEDLYLPSFIAVFSDNIEGQGRSAGSDEELQPEKTAEG